MKVVQARIEIVDAFDNSHYGLRSGVFGRAVVIRDKRIVGATFILRVVVMVKRRDSKDGRAVERANP